VGVPASLGPGLRTVSGAERGTGPKLPRAIPAMSGESRKSKKMLLAMAVAEGEAVAAWARNNGVPERTAYQWAKESDFAASVESLRRRMVDRAVGRLASITVAAADRIKTLSEDANSESVKLSANRAVFTDYIALSKYAGLEGRVARLEERARERANNPS
jgi:hypothetical protein